MRHCGLAIGAILALEVAALASAGPTHPDAWRQASPLAPPQAPFPTPTPDLFAQVLAQRTATAEAAVVAPQQTVSALRTQDTESQQEGAPVSGDLIVAIIGAVATLLAALGGYISGQVKAEKDLQAKYNEILLTKRITAYLDLWHRLEPLAMEKDPKQMDAADVEILANSLTTWYYGSGLLLSGVEDKTDKHPTDQNHSYRGGSFPVFMVLYKALHKERKVGKGITVEEVPRFRQMGSALRTQLTVDVGTRRVLDVGKRRLLSR